MKEANDNEWLEAVMEMLTQLIFTSYQKEKASEIQKK